MTPDAYRRAGILFDQLRVLPKEQRSAILDAACADNQEFRRQVLLLLESDEAAADRAFLERRVQEDAARPVSAQEAGLPAPGTMIGIYRLEERIGAGGMGVVYQAEDTRLERRVAVKILPLLISGEGPERVKRFQREARAISMLNHPNIVSIFDAGCDQRYWYIATEFIEGVTLRQRLAGGPLRLEEALDIAIQCATALAAAHAAGVLHRDIKPENIMLRPDGVVKVVDFGLARVRSRDDAGATHTGVGTILGTPRYMAPEQARGEDPDARCDIFSLGAVLYEMAAGRPAFPGEATADVLASLLTTESAPPSEWNRQCPPEFDPVIVEALEKDREARYQTMEEFAFELREFKQRIEARRHVQTWRESRKRAWAMGAVLAGIVLAASGALAWRSWPAAGGVQREGPRNPIPLTSFAGYKDHPALSPDGDRVAFSWNGGQGGSGGKQERNIYVQPVGSGSPVQLTDSAEDNLWPAWSQDGRLIAFSRRMGEFLNSVYIVPAAGGPERKVAQGGHGVSWSPDGKTLALARSWPNESGGIFLLSLESGETREFTDPRPDFDNFPAYSPDGQWIAFSRGRTSIQRDIWVAPAAGGTPKQITFEGSRIVGFAWTADSQQLIVSMYREASSGRLWRVSIRGGEPTRVNVGTDATNPTISLRGNRLAYNDSFLDTNIYRHDGPATAGRTAPGPFGAQRGLVLSSREDHSPAFSADGQWIAFISRRSGNTELWIARHDGSNPKQLTSFQTAGVGTPRWSPDSRWIAFDCSVAGAAHIYLMAVDGSGRRRLTDWDSTDVLPSWSPDGKWIYFTSDQPGGPQLWKAPSSGGRPAQVSRGRVREAWPSPDGKLVYFTRQRPEAELWMLPAEGGLEQPVPELKQFNRISRAWGVIDDGIYFISRENGPTQEVRFFSFATRRVSVIAVLEKEPIWTVPSLALSRDGRVLLSTHLDHEVNDLMLIENFH